MPDLLETAAEPNRRRLLQLLGSGERSVTELAGELPRQQVRDLPAPAVAGRRRAGPGKKGRPAALLQPEPAGHVPAAGLACHVLDHRAGPIGCGRLRIGSLHHTTPTPRRIPMTIEQSVFIPVDPDTAFALITEPERLRRWKDRRGPRGPAGGRRTTAGPSRPATSSRHFHGGRAGHGVSSSPGAGKARTPRARMPPPSPSP